jgi:hypothetical protein
MPWAAQCSPRLFTRSFQDLGDDARTDGVAAFADGAAGDFGDVGEGCALDFALDEEADGWEREVFVRAGEDFGDELGGE